MKHRIFIDGAEGTTGLRLRDDLLLRSDIELIDIAPEQRKDPAARARCLNEADVAFLCLPDAAALEAVSWVRNPRTCIIDASTAHRTHPGWVYGLPELEPMQRDRLIVSRRISNPGCHATAFVLLVRPLIDAGVIEPDAALMAHSITGYSGGGKAMIAQYQEDEDRGRAGQARRLLAPRPYGLGLSHKHLPEMAAHTGLLTPPTFTPVVGPYARGLQLSLPLQWRQLRLNHLEGHSDMPPAQQIRGLLARRYHEQAFVKVHAAQDMDDSPGGFFDVQANNGSNRVDLHVFASEQHLLLSARLDNLGKGASGAAVQCMNIHLGLEEGLGLQA